jgi:hypothetical protein
MRAPALIVLVVALAPAALAADAEGCRGLPVLQRLPGFTARRGTTWVQLVSEPLDARSGYTVTMVRAGLSGAPRRRPAARH